MKKLGPTFGEEIAEAGLAGLPLGWNEDGDVFGRENLTSAQALALDVVISSHDPTKQPNSPPPPEDVSALKSELANVKSALVDILSSIQEARKA